MNDQRKFIHFHCFVFLFIIYPFTLSSTEYLTVGGEKYGWEVSVHPDRGTIKQFRQLMGDVWETIPFRDDSLAGPAWSGMQLLNVLYLIGEMMFLDLNIPGFL